MSKAPLLSTTPRNPNMSTTPPLRKRVTSHTRRPSVIECKRPPPPESLAPKERRLERLPSSASQLDVIHEGDVTYEREEARGSGRKEGDGGEAEEAWWKLPCLRECGGDAILRFCGR